MSGLLVFLLSRLDGAGSVSMLLLVTLFALVHLVAMSLRLGRVGMVLWVSRGSLLTLLVVAQRLFLLSTLLLRLDLIFLLVTLGLLTDEQACVRWTASDPVYPCLRRRRVSWGVQA